MLSVKCLLLGHDWSDGTQVANTCQFERTCARCAKSETLRVQHPLGAWIEEVPSCRALATCKLCSEVVIVARHVWGEWEKAEQRDYIRRCTTCGQQAPQRARWGHDWGPSGVFDGPVVHGSPEQIEASECRNCGCLDVHRHDDGCTFVVVD